MTKHGGADGADLAQRISFCRICNAGCGTVLSINADQRIVRIQGDRSNPLSRGYACFKGLQSGTSHHGQARQLHSLKRMPDTSLKRISSEGALDEIGTRLAAIIDRYGPNAVALFCGNGAIFNTTAMNMQQAFLQAIGSTQYYSTLTIDQSAKLVSLGRLGGWGAGLPEFEQMAVAVMFAANPLVSHASPGYLTADPVKRLKKARANGLKLVVIDPRLTETARQADAVFQPYPGRDALIAGGVIRAILSGGHEDRHFCNKFVGADRVARLRAAVEPLTCERVEALSGLPSGAITAIVSMMVGAAGPACAHGATGTNMAPYSNLAQHLIDTINVVLGSYLRAGDEKTQAIVQDPPSSPREGVICGDRPWEQQPPSRIRGAGQFYGERLSATLADEILTPGEGQIRALIVDGGDPATSIPGQQNVVDALRSLDLLVTIDPWLSPTSRLAHYVLAPRMQYERADVTAHIPGYPLWPGRWAQYTESIINPPVTADLMDDWYVFWRLAKNLGRVPKYCGKHALDFSRTPTTDELLSLQLYDAVVDFDDLKSAPHGLNVELGDVFVQPAACDDHARFDVMPDDIEEELKNCIADFSSRSLPVGERMLLTTRRMRDLFNSNGIHNEAVRSRNPANPAQLNPQDMAVLGLSSGDRVRLSTASGSVIAVAQPDNTMRRGVLSLPHGWGMLPDESDPELANGSCVNALFSADQAFETINAMPHMSGIEVRVEKYS